MLNTPKNENYFRYFRGKLMNLGIDYDDEVEKENTNGRIELI